MVQETLSGFILLLLVSCAILVAVSAWVRRRHKRTYRGLSGLSLLLCVVAGAVYLWL